MGCVTIDGVMYSLRPYVRGAISRTPYPPTVEDVDIGNDTYRLIPVELHLNFDDDEHRHVQNSKLYYIHRVRHKTALDANSGVLASPVNTS